MNKGFIISSTEVLLVSKMDGRSGFERIYEVGDF
jgi:hypothetical protein